MISTISPKVMAGNGLMLVSVIFQMIGLGDLEKNSRHKSRFTYLVLKYHAQRVGQDHAEIIKSKAKMFCTRPSVFSEDGAPCPPLEESTIRAAPTASGAPWHSQLRWRPSRRRRGALPRVLPRAFFQRQSAGRRTFGGRWRLRPDLHEWTFRRSSCLADIRGFSCIRR